MRVSILWKRAPVAVLAFTIALSGATLLGQEQPDAEEEDDSDLALARATQVWTVIERTGSQRWDASWTLRADGKTFDAHWKHQPGGDEGDLHAFARISSIRGSSIVIERAGLGKYTGTLSSDRMRITGRMSWSPGTWEVRLPGRLPGGSAAAAPVTVSGNHWAVVESVGGGRWTADWVLRSDGRSFDASWTHTPGNDRGHLTNFAHIVSISGNQITIDRPGLGKYTGTISADRRSIRGRMSWADGTWVVRLPNSALPARLP